MSWASKLSDPYRVNHGKKFRLKDFDPASTAHIHSKEHAQELLDRGIAEMRDLHDKLYAQDRWAVLIILQGMDAAGKDGLIKHVMSGVNPQGCQVYSFKQPSVEELNHDFMWRSNQRLPERGHIGIFNRSYYEEVLVVRVHPDILKNERVPEELMTKEHLAGAIRGHQKLRALSGAQRNGSTKILFEYFEERTEAAVS